MNKVLNIGLLCGGPSLERGISLNSARSLLDHLSSEQIEIHPIYVDHFKNFYSISKFQLYSNTPSDFDFKLAQTAEKLSEDELLEKLESLDLVFPAMHGAFGEDGEIQTFLEKHDIPHVGCDSASCKKMFFKNNAAEILAENGYETFPTKTLSKNDPENESIIHAFFKTHQLKRAVVKPTAGGSSLGVFSAYTPEEAFGKLKKLFDMDIDDNALLEPFCEGREFTVIVLQNSAGAPVSLIPSEIIVSYDNGQIFDYRRKYLPTHNTSWPCPPSFNDEVVASIQQQAEGLFKLFGMRDFARLDGWVLDDGRILFTDFNPISGMEQNSFIFQQSSRVGLTHRDVLTYVVKNALARYGKTFEAKKQSQEKREKINVIFGGATAERQVSLMSGTNAWLKLRESKKYDPTPYFLDKDNNVWSLPYTYAFNHTVEEIYENCVSAVESAKRLEWFTRKIRKQLGLDSSYNIMDNLPEKMTMDQFLKKLKGQFLFLGLHGGDGEDGTLQKKLEEHNIMFNGSGSKASRTCMDKFETSVRINSMDDDLIGGLPKQKIRFSSKVDCEALWNRIAKDFSASSFVIKPNYDGCSAGIVRLHSAQDLLAYAKCVQNKHAYIPENTFKNQSVVIEMAHNPNAEYILEPFIETDKISIHQNQIIYQQKESWLEFTVGVLESKGAYHSLSPSITIASGEVLSLEEKFQGGTGINITPPPEDIVSRAQIEKIKRGIEKVAKALEIENYARIDVFFNIKTEKIIVIEANSLPALTPSTVIYHQGIAEKISLSPVALLERIIDLKKESQKSKRTAA